MKKITLVLAMLILTAAFAAGPCAAEPAGDAAASKKDQKKSVQKAEKKAAKKTGSYVGEVMEVDLKTDKMLVAPKNSSLAMVLNTSKVKKGLNEVKVGDWVEATFEAKVGTLYALTVTQAKRPEESKKSSELKKGAPAQRPANHP